MNTSTTIRKTRSHHKISGKLQFFGLILAGLMSLSFVANAGTYTITQNGKYNDDAIWSPAYPGNVINEGDTVIIKSHVKLNLDVVVKGILKVDEKSSLVGSKNLVVLDNGTFMNSGISIATNMTNRGSILNKHILETTEDFINTGNIVNNQSLVVGAIMDNTGLISGNGGQVMANDRMVNSAGGSIQGQLDVCSNNFMNVSGGVIDSVNLSFCGNRIFTDVILTAAVKKDKIQLNLLNSENKRFKQYDIERSTDGENFESIASLTEDDIEDFSVAFNYADTDKVKSESVYYRMKLTTHDDKQNVLSPVQVGNLSAGAAKVSK